MRFCISYSKILGVRGRHSDLPIIASITTATDIDTIFINPIFGLQQKESFISCNQGGMEGNSSQIEKAHQRHQQLQKQFTHPTSIHFYVDFQRLAAESLQAWIYTKFHVWRKFKVCSFSPFCNPSTYTLLFSQLPPSYIEIIQVPSKPMLANLSFPRAKIRYWSAGLICPSPIWTHDEVWAVSGLNATDKTTMYEMPLICVCGLAFRVSIICSGVLGNGILSLAFCPEIGLSKARGRWNY